VLEYCKGTDLDEKLKCQRTIAEKDAKAILLQMISGLKYLHNPSNPSTNLSDSDHDGGEEKDHNSIMKRKSIIHYDLKPGNILFDEFGDVKITDFGLSKIIDNTSEATSLELTSQGDGMLSNCWILIDMDIYGNNLYV
jgi:tousled-like kinase